MRHKSTNRNKNITYKFVRHYITKQPPNLLIVSYESHDVPKMSLQQLQRLTTSFLDQNKPQVVANEDTWC